MITKESVLELQKKGNGVHISVYIPTHRNEPEVQQDPIRFKNMIARMEKEMEEKSIPSEQIKAVIEKAENLLDDTMFWRHNDKGLAVFITPDLIHHYKLPIRFEERFMIDDRFLITPLIRMISLEGSFCILVLSQKEVRLLRCTRDSTERIELDDAPTSMDEFRRFDLYQKSIQHHSGQGQGTAIFHGHGGGDDDTKVILEYLKSIENTVTTEMHKRNDPLLLAGVENAVAHYHKINHYQRLMDDALIANPDPIPDKQLGEQGWELIREHFLKDMYSDLDRLGDLTGSDKISVDIVKIVEAAWFGKVDTLFIPKETEYHGEIGIRDPEASDDGSEILFNTDLINLATILTLQKGGDVYALETTQSAISNGTTAIYRYA